MGGRRGAATVCGARLMGFPLLVPHRVLPSALIAISMLALFQTDAGDVKMTRLSTLSRQLASMIAMDIFIIFGKCFKTIIFNIV